MRKLAITLLCLVISGSALCEEVMMTSGMLNGRGWNELRNAESKLSLVIGVHDTYITLLAGSGAKKNENLEMLFLNVTYSEIIESLDGFYSNPLWRKIPVVIALDCVGFRLKQGLSEQRFDEYVSKMLPIW